MDVKGIVMHLALAFDRNFITPFYALSTSIFYNNRSNRFIFHTIATGVTESEKKEIIDFINGNGSEIVFYDLDQDKVGSFVIPDNSHFSVATYYRLFFPALMPKEVKKLLYIDTDIIVTGDLFELYNLSFFPMPVAAALDAQVSVREDLGIFERGKYFNAGVLLINVDEWEKQEISKKTIRFLNDFPEKIKFVDQDALNATLIDNWHRLDNKYNLTFYDIPKNLRKKEIDAYLKDKVIIHYTTQHKPWLLACTNRLRHLYHYYLDKSPHALYGKYKDEEQKSQLRYKLMKRNLKELLIDIGVPV